MAKVSKEDVLSYLENAKKCPLDGLHCMNPFLIKKIYVRPSTGSSRSFKYLYGDLLSVSKYL